MHANRLHTSFEDCIPQEAAAEFGELIEMNKRGEILGYTKTFTDEIERAEDLAKRAFERLAAKAAGKKRRRDD